MPILKISKTLKLMGRALARFLGADSTPSSRAALCLSRYGWTSGRMHAMNTDYPQVLAVPFLAAVAACSAIAVASA